MEQKDVKLVPMRLKVDGDIIIDSINTNEFDWQIEKSIEVFIDLAAILSRHRKGLFTTEDVCDALADVAIQTEILTYLFSTEFTQNCINKRLISIRNKAKRIDKRIDFRRQIGFRGDG